MFAEKLRVACLEAHQRAIRRKEQKAKKQARRKRRRAMRQSLSEHQSATTSDIQQLGVISEEEIMKDLDAAEPGAPESTVQVRTEASTPCGMSYGQHPNPNGSPFGTFNGQSLPSV